MALRVVFGWYLDGSRYPETCDQNNSMLGGLICGPARFATELALRLGIAHASCPQAIRIAKYMKALEECDDGNQYYSKSFQLDAWSTASCMLVWRDDLITAGWNGSKFENGTPKLTALAQAEQLSNPLGCNAEVLREILYRLRANSRINLPIKSIKLITPLRLLPPIWQEIFDHLKKRQIELFEPTFNDERGSVSDLSRVQAFMLNGKKSILQNDGTFTLLEADDEFQLSECTTAWLKGSGFALSDLVIVRNSPTSILDGYCAANALPRIGGYESSRWRSALQVLPLMLQSSWLPANPYRTLELISLPESPIPKSASYHFIQALRAEPGFGGERWISAWKNLEASLLEKQASDNLDTAKQDISLTLKNLRFWLEPDRFDPQAGMPTTRISKICQEIRKWASSCLRRDSRNQILIHAINAAHELEMALSVLGFSTINQLQLNRLVDAVYGEGCKPEIWRAECSDWSNVDLPGQVWSSAKHLLWWGFNANTTLLPRQPPWTAYERLVLSDAAVNVESSTAPALRLAHSWKQALLNVQDSVLLCRARFVEGQITNTHPLADEFVELIGHCKTSIIKNADEVLSKKSVVLGLRKTELAEIHLREIPKSIRNWKGPSNKQLYRQEESATSIAELIGCPLAWVLRHHAQLHPGILLSLPEGDKLVGDIAHALFHRLLEEGVSDSEITIRANKLFDELILSVGLPLLLQGRNLERQRAKRSIVQAFNQFRVLLEDAQLKVIGCEASRQGPFFTGSFSGKLDTILESEDGTQSFVVDFKWNKSAKYRLDELIENRHLQLAAYAWLESIHAGKLPRIGYYMLRQRRFLHSGEEPVPEFGEFVKTLPVMQIWHEIQSSYISRMDEINKGFICATGIPNEAPEQNVECEFYIDPPCKFCQFSNLCGKRGLEHD